MINNTLDCEITKCLIMENKINVSALSRKYGMSRNAIRRHIKNASGKSKIRKARKCGLLACSDHYVSELSNVHNSLKSIYMKLLKLYSIREIGSYSNFVQYVRKHYKDLRVEAKQQNDNFRYETSIGKQMQFDWIENLKITLTTGEICNFNLFSATLGYSRFHTFIPSVTKNQEDLIRCLVETFINLGGLPEEVLTDNMAAVVNKYGEKRVINIRISQFFKDLNIELKLCKPRKPRTKGKVEVSNKYQNWLSVYDGKFDTESQLFNCIKTLLIEPNFQRNSETKIPPYVLFNKIEKKSLKDLPNIKLLMRYHSNLIERKVDNCGLLSIDGAKYGLEKRYACKNVLFNKANNKINIYDLNLNFICSYDVFYHGIHYNNGLYEALQSSLPKNMSKDEFQKNVDDNLSLLANLGKYDLENK